MSLSRKTMDHPILILIVFMLLGMLGIFTYSKIAVALMPETENPTVTANKEPMIRIAKKVVQNSTK